MDALLRMLDANANRAREGLRVMEDIARFGRNDAELASAIKGVRHAVTDAVAGMGVSMLALHASRDTPGDVGTGTKTHAELTRGGLPAIAAAAGGRATEALRVIGEAAKALGPTAARAGAAIEALRYQTYELNRRLLLALGTGRGVQWRLCVLLTESLCRRPWLEVARLGIEGGADCLQLREKGLGDAELLSRAKALLALSRTATGGCAVIVNDRVDVALLAGADGVHLGQGDMRVQDARSIAGDRLLVGVSTHDLSEAEGAWRDGADYLGVGAMFATSTKARATSGPAYLREVLADERLRAMPHLAIGGISPDNVGELVAAGVRGVAVSGAVCGAADPAAVCRSLRERLGSSA